VCVRFEEQAFWT